MQPEKFLQKVLCEGRKVLDMNTKINNLDEMIHTSEFRDFIDSKLGNDLFISEPDRASRIADAAEEGADGSTHREHIDDQREFLDMLAVFDPEYDEVENIARYDITQEVYDNISKELDEIEEWHQKNGDLDKEVG